MPLALLYLAQTPSHQWGLFWQIKSATHALPQCLPPIVCSYLSPPLQSTSHLLAHFQFTYKYLFSIQYKNESFTRARIILSVLLMEVSQVLGVGTQILVEWMNESQIQHKPGWSEEAQPVSRLIRDTGEVSVPQGMLSLHSFQYKNPEAEANIESCSRGNGRKDGSWKIAKAVTLVSLGKSEAGQPCVTLINHPLHTTWTQMTTFVHTSCLQRHDIWSTGRLGIRVEEPKKDECSCPGLWRS